MSSRRKSTTPCMVPPQQVQVHSDQEMLMEEDDNDVSDSQGGNGVSCEADLVARHQRESLLADSGSYECKYCSFQTSELQQFTLHLDTEHQDLVANTSYICTDCDYHTKSLESLLAHNARHHPGEQNSTRTTVKKRLNELVVQQSLNDLAFDGSSVKEEGAEPGEAETQEPGPESCQGIALSKTPIMRSRSRTEPKKFSALHKMAVEDIIKVESDDEEVEDLEGEELEEREEEEEEEGPPALSPAPAAATLPRLVPISSPLQVHSVPQGLVVNSPSLVHIKGGGSTSGGGGVGGGVLPAATLAQVLSALQNQQNQQGGAQTQLLIPISSIPTYNTAMDSNVLLASAYNRFPYPSLSEIVGLSSQTKFSEEQIKVWFSAQRLKHGVSWTPEEVEEARKKKFNGTVQSVPQTITVIPANLAAATNGLPSIFQTCQIVGQPGLVLAQVGGTGGTVPVAASPITLTVAGVPGNRPKAAEPTASESKTELAAAGGGGGGMASEASGSKPKKSKEQLAELKASYGRRQFASEAEISRLMAVTRLSKRAIKKWFSDTRYNQRNSRDHTHPSLLLGDASTGRAAGRGGGGGGGRDLGGGGDLGGSGSTTIIIDSSDDASDSSPTSTGPPPPVVHPAAGGSGGSSSSPPSSSERRAKFRHAFPDFTPQRFKEKTAEQLAALEDSFRTSDTPTDEELSRLRAQTKLTRREVDAWFTERRKASSAAAAEAEGGGSAATGSSQNSAATPPSGGGSSSRRLVKKTPEQLHLLKKAFIRSQWPSAEEYQQLALESGLPRSYIVNWFGDTRYACKNSNLKWFYLYHSGKVDEALNGGAKTHKKSRKRFRGWSRRTRRPYPTKRSPQGDASTIKVKSGKAFLKEYYLKNGALREPDLDELVAKSGMSYEQVRSWFTDTTQRAAEGGGAIFSEEEEEEEEEEELEEEEEELEEEAAAAGAAEHSDGAMEAKEQGEEATEEEMEEEEEGEEEEEEGEALKEDSAMQEESAAVGQSKPEEQT